MRGAIRADDLERGPARVDRAGSRSPTGYDWTTRTHRTTVNRRLRAWLAQWGPVLPLLLAEATIWLGFGALLPILPIYFTQHGVDLPTLGVVVAAWPAARLVGEPFFGWLADRVARRPMMITGLVLASVFAVLPLFIVGPAAFILFRACSGMAAAMYDPAARAYLVDANPPERQGEAFGLYGAAQTGGFMLGPAIGGVLAAITGQPTVVFWVAGISLLVSAILVAVLVPEREHLHAEDTATATAAAVAAGEDEVVDAAGWSRPVRLLNVLLVAAIMFNVGSYFAGGSYEVIWSLYMTSLGADLAAIGLTFFSFGLPPLLLSPFTGRFIDREGGFWALVLGVAGIGICGLLYPLVPEIWWMVVLGLVEGVGVRAAVAGGLPARGSGRASGPDVVGPGPVGRRRDRGHDRRVAGGRRRWQRSTCATRSGSRGW